MVTRRRNPFARAVLAPLVRRPESLCVCGDRRSRHQQDAQGVFGRCLDSDCLCAAYRPEVTR